MDKKFVLAAEDEKFS